MRCEEPVKIIEILRLWEQGYSQREIAASVKCAKSTVGEVQRRCKEHSLYEHEPDERLVFVWLSLKNQVKKDAQFYIIFYNKSLSRLESHMYSTCTIFFCSSMMKSKIYLSTTKRRYSKTV